MTEDLPKTFYTPNLSKHHLLSLVTDEFMPIVNKMKHMPIGMVSLIIDTIEAIEQDKYPEIMEREKGVFLSSMYFMLGSMLTTDNQNLLFSEEQMDKELEEIKNSVINRIGLIGLICAGYVTPTLKDGQWNYNISDAGKEKIEEWVKSGWIERVSGRK